MYTNVLNKKRENTLHFKRQKEPRLRVAMPE